MRFPGVGWVVLTLALGMTLKGGYYWLRSNRLEGEIALLRADNAKRNAEIAELQKRWDSQNALLLQTTQALEQTNARLADVNRHNAELIAILHQERDARLQSVPTLPPPEIVTQTLAELKLQPPAVRITSDGLIAFQEPAARTNLAALISGNAAIAELPLAQERITNLGEQVQNLQKVDADLRQVIANKDAEIKVQKELADMRVNELEKELAVQRATGRKHNFIIGVITFVAGLIVGAI